MPSLSTQERKAKFNKISNLLSGILLFLSTDTFFHLGNGYKLLGTKSKQIPKISLSLVLLKKLKEDQVKNIIKEFKNELKDLKNIPNKINEPELLREQEINTPCPSAPVRCALVASPVSKFAEIAFPVANYASPANKYMFSTPIIKRRYPR